MLNFTQQPYGNMITNGNPIPLGDMVLAKQIPLFENSLTHENILYIRNSFTEALNESSEVFFKILPITTKNNIYDVRVEIRKYHTQILNERTSFTPSNNLDFEREILTFKLQEYGIEVRLDSNAELTKEGQENVSNMVAAMYSSVKDTLKRNIFITLLNTKPSLNTIALRYAPTSLLDVQDLISECNMNFGCVIKEGIFRPLMERYSNIIKQYTNENRAYDIVVLSTTTVPIILNTDPNQIKFYLRGPQNNEPFERARSLNYPGVTIHPLEVNKNKNLDITSHLYTDNKLVGQYFYIQSKFQNKKKYKTRYASAEIFDYDNDRWVRITPSDLLRNSKVFDTKGYLHSVDPSETKLDDFMFLRKHKDDTSFMVRRHAQIDEKHIPNDYFKLYIKSLGNTFKKQMGTSYDTIVTDFHQGLKFINEIYAKSSVFKSGDKAVENLWNSTNHYFINPFLVDNFTTLASEDSILKGNKESYMMYPVGFASIPGMFFLSTLDLPLVPDTTGIPSVEKLGETLQKARKFIYSCRHIYGFFMNTFASSIDYFLNGDDYILPHILYTKETHISKSDKKFISFMHYMFDNKRPFMNITTKNAPLQELEIGTSKFGPYTKTKTAEFLISSEVVDFLKNRVEEVWKKYNQKSKWKELYDVTDETFHAFCAKLLNAETLANTEGSVVEKKFSSFFIFFHRELLKNPDEQYEASKDLIAKVFKLENFDTNVTGGLTKVNEPTLVAGNAIAGFTKAAYMSQKHGSTHKYGGMRYDMFNDTNPQTLTRQNPENTGTATEGFHIDRFDMLFMKDLKDVDTEFPKELYERIEKLTYLDNNNLLTRALLYTFFMSEVKRETYIEFSLHDIPLPFDILGIRRKIEFQTQSVVIVPTGGVIGESFIGFADTTEGVNPKKKEKIIHHTCALGTAVYIRDLVHVIPHMVTTYKKGGGVTVRDSTDKGDIEVVLLPWGEAPTLKKHFSITGEWNEKIFNNLARIPKKRELHYSTAEYFSKYVYTDWASTDHQDFINLESQSRLDGINTVVSLETFISGGKVVYGDSVFGNPYPGCRKNWTTTSLTQLKDSDSFYLNNNNKLN